MSHSISAMLTQVCKAFAYIQVQITAYTYTKGTTYIASRLSRSFLCTCVYVVTCEEQPPAPLPEGLLLLEDFVSQEEEALLLAAVDWSATDSDVTGESPIDVLSANLRLC